MAEQINAFRIADRPDLYESAKNNAFQFILHKDLEKLVPMGMSEDNMDDSDYLVDVQERIKLAVDEASVPHVTISEKEVRMGNTSTWYAGEVSYDDTTLRVHDFVGARVKDILLAWQALAYDVNTGVVHKAANYRFDCTLQEYENDFSKPVRTWTLKNCWVTKLSEDSFSHSNADLRTITVTIKYDRAIPEIYKEVTTD